jgi:hypothetical protein
MKSINRIVVLTLAAVAIVMFWLLPGVNQATAVEYTRTYEDTDYPEPFLKDTTKKEKTPKPPKGYGRPEEKYEKKQKPVAKEKTGMKKVKEVEVKEVEIKENKSSASARPAKKYKRQSIRPKDKKFKLEAKMFSRAVQFVEEVPLDTAIVSADSAKVRPEL